MKKWLTMIAGVIMLICISVPVLASDTSETANTVIGVSVYNLNDAEVRAFRNYLENYIGITFNPGEVRQHPSQGDVQHIQQESSVQKMKLHL